MSKYKIGDRVKVIKNNTVSCNKIGEIGTIIEVDDCGARILGDITKKKSGNWSQLDEIELYPRTIDDVQEGDEVVNGEGYKRTVLHRAGKMVFLSKIGYREKYWVTFSIKDLKDYGYTLVQDTPEVIEINGKKYKADEINERLAELKPIE